MRGTKYIPNLPLLPSELLDGCDLAKNGYWIRLSDEVGDPVGGDPTRQDGKVVEICALGAVLRAFGLLAPIYGLGEAIRHDTECGEFMVALARKVNPSLPDRFGNGTAWGYTIKKVLISWSDHADTAKADAVATLREVERELGYSV